MSDTNQEPTMEEILASIRRIISEDEPAPGAAPAAAGDGGETASSPATVNTADEEVLDLTERVEDAGAAMETVGDLDVYSSRNAPVAEPAPQPEPARQEAPQPMPEPSYQPAAAASSSSGAGDDGLLSQSSAASAAAAFGSLSQALMMPQEGRSLEDVVRELLRPLLKEWLDANLPQIVQAKVQEEVERIARSRSR
ncbi:MAG TPA: DUF2497 domain-containing protein [Caulobacteraceae bacterium]|jgi:hypothetical protein